MNDNWVNLILSISIWTVAKFLILFALIIYLIFAIVLIQQVNAMTKVVSGQWNIPLKVLSWVHLLVALLVIILAIVIL